MFSKSQLGYKPRPLPPREAMNNEQMKRPEASQTSKPIEPNADDPIRPSSRFNET